MNVLIGWVRNENYSCFRGVGVSVYLGSSYLSRLRCLSFVVRYWGMVSGIRFHVDVVAVRFLVSRRRGGSCFVLLVFDVFLFFISVARICYGESVSRLFSCSSWGSVLVGCRCDNVRCRWWGCFYFYVL